MLPSFMLDAVPVLGGFNSDAISTLGSESVSSNPYPFMARPRKSFSSLYSQSESLEFERDRETRSVSSHLPAPTPLFQTSSTFASNSGNPASGRSTPSSVRRFDSPSSPNSDSCSHRTHPSVSSIPGNIRTVIEPLSSSPGGTPNIDSAHWRSGRFGSTATRNPQLMPARYHKSSAQTSPVIDFTSLNSLEDRPPEPKILQAADHSNLRSTPNLKGIPQQEGSFSQSPLLSQTPTDSALSTTSYMAPRSRNASGQHVVYPNPLLSVFWKANDSAEWTMDRVIYWLEFNKFGQDWIDTFRKKNLHGEEFLSLVSYQKLKNLGQLSAMNDVYDTRPSRFIHILRKVLDKSISNTSNGELGNEQATDFTDNYIQNSDPKASHLRPMRSEYSLGNPYSSDSSSRTAVNSHIHLPTRNKSLENLYSDRARNRLFTVQTKEDICPLPVAESFIKPQVWIFHFC